MKSFKFINLCSLPDSLFSELFRKKNTKNVLFGLEIDDFLMGRSIGYSRIKTFHTNPQLVITRACPKKLRNQEF